MPRFSKVWIAACRQFYVVSLLLVKAEMGGEATGAQGLHKVWFCTEAQEKC